MKVAPKDVTSRRSKLLGCGRFFFDGHLAHLGIIVGQHLFGAFQVVLGRGVVLEAVHHGFQLRIFSGKISELVLIADHVRIGQQGGDFLMAIDQIIQFVQD